MRTLNHDALTAQSGHKVDGVAPAKPANLLAEAGDAKVTLSWDRPERREHRPLRDEAGFAAAWAEISGSGASTVSHEVTSLQNGTAYTFRVRAVDGVGNAGPASDAATATPMAAAKPKVSLSLAASTIAESGAGSTTTVTATLDEAVTGRTVVTLKAEPSGAVRLSASTLTIAQNAKASTDTVTVTAVDNDLDAADAEVTLSGTVDNAAVAAPDAVTLTDDDDAPELSIDSPSVDEGDSGSATASRATASPAALIRRSSGSCRTPGF